MVHLGKDCDPSPFEPFDQPDLPQRVAPVHRALRQPPDKLPQRLRVSGRGDDRVPDVMDDVEIGVVDPDGVIEAQRHLDQTLAENRRRPGLLLHEAL